jgi:hypothetical protein
MDRRHREEIISALIPRGQPSSYPRPMQNRILARAKNATGDLAMAEDDPVASIDALLAKVRVPTALKNAQEAFHDLQREHAQLRDELRNAIVELREAGGESATNSGAIVRRIHLLDKRLTELGEQSRVALETIIRERAPFVEAAQRALAGPTKEAARRMLRAAAEMQLGLAELDAIEVALSSIGGSPGRRMLHLRDALPSAVAWLSKLAIG